jgi:hypothetical protein
MMGSTPSENDDLAYLLNAAAWQDSLLQSYRSLHLSFQSILLAIGIGLFLAILSFDYLCPVLISSFIFLWVWALQVISLKNFKGIVTARGADVNFWHCAIIMAENNAPMEKRYFTKFKIHQKEKRNQEVLTALQAKFLSENKISSEEANLLIEKGEGHTRKVIDRKLFSNIFGLWMFLLIATLVICAWKILAL